MNPTKNLETGCVDLHLHTIASDGTVGLDSRVEQALEHGLETIAITDHDVILDALSQPIEHRNGVEVITGVEIRADLFDTKVEILGYLIDPSDKVLASILAQARAFRRQRNVEMVSKLADATGLNLSYDSLAESVEGNLGRPHLADILIDEEIVDSVSEAFDQYLGETGAAFVPMRRCSAEDVIAAIRDAGGVTSLAHPGRIRADVVTVTRMVDRLSELGLDGIEVSYPYAEDRSDAYADIDVEDAMLLAERFDLVPTGGSDCHGPRSGKYRIGTVRISTDSVARIQRISEERQ